MDTNAKTPRPPMSAATARVVLVLGLVVMAVLVAWTWLALPKHLPPGSRTMEANNLKQIGLALHWFADTHDNRFPQAVAYRSKDGRPLLSWRVLILPYIEQEALYKQFRLDEPWDSEHNIQLLDRMPKTYARANDDAGHTRYLLVTGKGTAFDEGFAGGKSLDTLRLGKTMKEMCRLAPVVGTLPARIRFLVAADPVPWTKPEDPDLDAGPVLPRLDKTFGGRTHVVSAEGSISMVESATEEEWQARLRGLVPED
ncbi:MAG: DUF1559 domain-containing protein [Gemmataceae bacterium]|nr:DUF1559 domain-containing protein [Gemmataceae bacterium]